MNLLLKIIGVLFAIILMVILYLGISYIIPYPYSKINIIFALLILAIFIWDSGWIVWITFLTHLFLELFSTAPFGVIIFSSTISMLLAYWLYHHIFTNRSWYSVLGLTFFVLFAYRLLYISILGILFLFNIINIIPWQLMLVTFVWELLFTLVAVMLLYLISTRLTTKFQASVIESHLFRYVKKNQ